MFSELELSLYFSVGLCLVMTCSIDFSVRKRVCPQHSAFLQRIYSLIELQQLLCININPLKAEIGQVIVAGTWSD